MAICLLPYLKTYLFLVGLFSISINSKGYWIENQLLHKFYEVHFCLDMYTNMFRKTYILKVLQR